MNKIEKTIRNFADMVGIIFGMVESDTNKNKSPLWSVVAMVIVRIFTISLLLLAAYTMVM